MAYTQAQYEQAFAAAAARYGIDWSIGRRQIQQESGFRCVTSSAGAGGPAQFLPGTWAQYGSGDRCNPAAAAEAWARYMSHLLSIFGGDYRLALAGYHSGEGAARAALRNCRGNPRTCDYVNRIMGGAASPPSTVGASSPLPAVDGPGFDLSGIFGGISTAALVAFGVVAFLILKD